MKKPQSIRNNAMNLLARREHSVQELQQKLGQKGFAQSDILAAIEQLRADNLQSDARFAESFVNQRVNAGFGPVKIRHELKQRGVADELIDEFLDLFSNEWHQRMLEQKIRKFGDEMPIEYAQRMKQARFLQNRGFSPELVMRLFR